MTARRLIAAKLIAIAGYAIFLRPRMLRWGATDEELRTPYPGADLIPDGRRTSTMACTLDAPPAEVWPWLVQMGHDRAGWYRWDLLDNSGKPSAEKIHPEWQQIRLVVSGYAAGRPHLLQGLASALIWEPAHCRGRRSVGDRLPEVVTSRLVCHTSG